MKVAVTGGHLSPALATIEVLLDRGWEVTYLGNKAQGDELEVISSRGISFHHIDTGKLHRHSKLKAGLSMMRVPVGITQALWALKKERVDVCLSFGGYLSVPCVLAARMLGIPIVTHEQTRQMGIANSVNGKFATCVAISFEESRKFFPDSKVVLVGNPIRTSALEIQGQPEEFELLPHDKTIYVSGGHQGSETVNAFILELLPELCSRWNVIHSLGVHALNEQTMHEALRVKALLDQPDSYIPARYFPPELIGAVYDRADMMVSRSGINTCTEFAQLRKPCILIPLPKGQQGEQLANANLMQNLGLGVVLEEKELSDLLLLEEIEKMMATLDTYTATKHDIDALFPLDAAERLADLTAQYAKSS